MSINDSENTKDLHDDKDKFSECKNENLPELHPSLENNLLKLQQNIDERFIQDRQTQNDKFTSLENHLLELKEMIEQRLTYDQTKNDKFTSLENHLLELKEMIEQRLTYDQTKDEAFNYLYSELKELKENALFESIKPVYIDLILLFDRIQTFCRNFEDASSSSISTLEVSGKFQSIRDELLEVLCRREIVMIQTDRDAAFNPSQQRAVSTKLTDNTSQNNTIESIVREGFNYRNQILRPEEVVVYKIGKRL
jgi:molecular chaperone GrpE